MSVDSKSIEKFIRENPKLKEILKRAVEYEELHSKDEHYLGGNGAMSEPIQPNL